MAVVVSELCFGVRLRLMIAAVLIGLLLVASMSVVVSAEPSLKPEAKAQNYEMEEVQINQVIKVSSTPKIRSGYVHVWPEMKIGWKIVVGSIVAFFGAACGSVGGIGGGGIFIPMLNLIIGFDAKSSTALSKCMITGTAAATVISNLRQRHPTLDMPVIDYDLALLMQPMLVLGISIGVSFNVIFADWMITVLLIIIFIGYGSQVEEFKCEPESLNNPTPEETQQPAKRSKVSLLKNVYWKELGIIVAVWFAILALQIAKNFTATCSVLYWILNALQVPVAGGVSAYQAIRLLKGKRKITSKGGVGANWRAPQLVFYCFCGIIAGLLGGILGLGGGFILGPLFLELGIPPQVASATSTFAMVFSSSMSVVEYYLLKRFPLPYALYLFAVATVAAFAGQYVVKKLIKIFGRASIIIFVLSFTILISVFLLGGVGIAKMISRIHHKQYMGFDDICSYTS
ncbi:hypothetical protein LWI28_023316 [Acer negundo]|uniref:Sulfite exporter TauE/SafE family protein n=1 Tax=Acer negundo TaxID=4023 RepID=A0AAD5IGS9_ACENE|nr:hypothetical protein LWI28_023316 [Acer negundo]